jgi:hypothetical protein
VDGPDFRAMILSLNPHLTDKDIPHRTTIQNRIIRRYKQDRLVLKQKLKESMGRVSITSDLWSNSSMRSFMAITLHWIARTHEGELELMTALGAFRYVKDKHDGSNLAAHFIHVLEELDIADRIGGITLDNATNNDTAMKHLEECLEDRGFSYNARQQRVRCFSHIINLAVQDALTALPEPENFNVQQVTDPKLKASLRRLKRDPAYMEALKTDLIARVSELIRQLRASGQRRRALEESILETRNDKRIDPPLSIRQLLRNVVTRWSSTFLMVDRFLYLTPAINKLLDGTNPADLNRDDSLNVKETCILDDVREFFSFFHSAQETLACEKTPTLPFVLPLYEDLLAALKELCEAYPNLMHAIYASIVKLEKYLLECRGSYLYTLAMSMSFRYPWIQKN